MLFYIPDTFYVSDVRTDNTIMKKDGGKLWKYRTGLIAILYRGIGFRPKSILENGIRHRNWDGVQITMSDEPSKNDGTKIATSVTNPPTHR